MKRGFCVACVLAFLALIPISGRAEEGRGIKIIGEVDPASFFVSPDMDGFNVQLSSGGTTWKEEIDGSTAWVPSVHGGIGLNLDEKIVIDGTVGAGWYVGGDVLSSTFLVEKVAGRYRINNVITLGVQFGLIQFDDLEWEGDLADDNVDFSDSDGYMGGLTFTAGTELVSFHLAVEYVDLDPFTVTTSGGWVASSNDLDLSGTLVTLGVRARF